MIRTSQSEGKVAEPSGAKRSVVCWNEDPQTHAIRVELNNGNFFVLPMSHFLSAEFTRGDKDDVLKLEFTTHGVTIRGLRLRAIALALQKLAVEWITEIAPKYTKLAEPNAAFVLSIEVVAVAQGALLDEPNIASPAR